MISAPPQCPAWVGAGKMCNLELTSQRLRVPSGQPPPPRVCRTLADHALQQPHELQPRGGRTKWFCRSAAVAGAPGAAGVADVSEPASQDRAPPGVASFVASARDVDAFAALPAPGARPNGLWWEAVLGGSEKWRQLVPLGVGVVTLRAMGLPIRFWPAPPPSPSPSPSPPAAAASMD